MALVIYRDDFRFLLDDVIPRQGRARADYDLVIASQPYRARVPVEFKAAKVVAPLARALRPGGRLLGIHSCGRDPGLEIIRKVWPDENPFQTTRHDLLRAVRAELGRDARHYNFNAYADSRAVFRYDMHTLPTEIAESIGTSTLFAAWNAAVYVAQIDDERLGERAGHAHAISTPRARCCRRTAACGSSMNPTSSRASAAEEHASPCRPTRACRPPPGASRRRELAAAAAELVACGSLEMGADTPEDARRIAELLPAGTPVYVNHLPRRELAHTLPALVALRQAGLEPVPHIAARRVASRAEAQVVPAAGRAAGRRQQGAADRRRRAPSRAGPYADGAALLARRPARRLRRAAGRAAPAIRKAIRALPPPRSRRAGREAGAGATRRGSAPYVVTQFSFAPNRIVEYCADLARRAPGVPVYVGLAGPDQPASRCCAMRSAAASAPRCARCRREGMRRGAPVHPRRPHRPADGARPPHAAPAAPATSSACTSTASAASPRTAAWMNERITARAVRLDCATLHLGAWHACAPLQPMFART